MNANGIAIFGFVSGFFTLVLLGYRRELKSNLPVIAVGLACCGVYGFLAGAWPLGFVLIALTASEIRRWRRVSQPMQRRVVSTPAVASEHESRIHRMFGPA
jgi:hypothetical protein